MATQASSLPPPRKRTDVGASASCHHTFCACPPLSACPRLSPTPAHSVWKRGKWLRLRDTSRWELLLRHSRPCRSLSRLDPNLKRQQQNFTQFALPETGGIRFRVLSLARESMEETLSKQHIAARRLSLLNYHAESWLGSLHTCSNRQQYPSQACLWKPCVRFGRTPHHFCRRNEFTSLSWLGPTYTIQLFPGRAPSYSHTRHTRHTIIIHIILVLTEFHV